MARRTFAGILRPALPAILLLLLVWSPVSTAALPIPSINHLPTGERWFGIYLNDERTGFSVTKIEETASGYHIASESVVKMTGLGFSRDMTARESYLVNRDLSLRSFEVSLTVDGSPRRITGEVGEKSIRVITESRGTTKEKTLAKKGLVYPPLALNLYPLLQDATKKKKFRITMFDPEAVSVKDVRITVVGTESQQGTEALHLRNNLYPFVDNDIWVDASGVTLRESVRDGMIETRLESEASARSFLTDAALSKKDLVLDFSLLKVEQPIHRPASLRRLSMELSGFPDGFPLFPGSYQKAERKESGEVIFTVDLAALKQADANNTPLDGRNRFLESTERILPENADIIRRKDEILGGTTEPHAVVEKLARWVADFVEDKVTDSRTPLETLEKRTGNCQSHSRLYVSLARAAGIPTRFVSGLVYAEGKGFLYHSWAESHVGYWLPVDPTFGEIPANATHIKLAEGDSADNMAPLAGIIGRIKGRVLDLGY
ncbi:MAG: transglutaminase-like domain-containing protein [Geobacteraceae bacterium]|nr:transglutaminase-like domain-containing protein [Geobacteraceae bacterium]